MGRRLLLGTNGSVSAADFLGHGLELVWAEPLPEHQQVFAFDRFERRKELLVVLESVLQGPP